MKLYKRVWRHAWAIPSWHCFHHRVDTVPYTACDKASRRSCYRRPSTANEQRANLDREHKSLIRGRRRKLVHAWDDISRSMWPKGWKDCTTKKKQWM